MVGPGAYTFYNTNKAVHNILFTKEKRRGPGSELNTPGPGTYNLKREFE